MIRVLLAALLVYSGNLCAQYWQGYNDRPVINPWDLGQENVHAGTRFTFARVRYTGFRHNQWRTDYPESDLNFSMRLEEVTTIEVNRDENGQIVHVVLGLDDDRIFDYPYLYLVEPGYLDLSDLEAKRLNEYLMRGGFLHVDDFWGPMEWANWEYQIRKVFPDEQKWPIIDIPMHHPIFNCVFQINEVPQVPSLWAWERRRSSTDRPGEEAHIRGIFDQQGRLLIVMTYNTDLGDGWEREGENYEYFRKFSVARAYPLGINIVVYAMTH